MREPAGTELRYADLNDGHDIKRALKVQLEKGVIEWLGNKAKVEW